MKTDWLEKIAAEMHQVWMDLYVERDGKEKAEQHDHFKPWGDELQAEENGVEAMNQDRFVASIVLRGYSTGDIDNQEDLPATIHNAVQLWIRLSGERLQQYHVPYHESNDRAIKERTAQADRVWPILQSIENIQEIRELDWLQ